MKYDRRWLSACHDGNDLVVELNEAIPLLPLRDRRLIDKAFQAVREMFLNDVENGFDVENDWRHLAELLSLTEGLIRKAECEKQKLAESFDNGPATHVNAAVSSPG